MTKGLTVKLTLFFCLLFILSFPVCGKVTTGDLGLGLTYPGLGVRYFLSNKIALEGKVQLDKDIAIFGLRWYWYLRKMTEVLLFTGMEIDIISFKGEQSEGLGFANEVYFGAEYFLNNKYSVQLDIGSALISLQDKYSSVSVSGIEYVVNFGINYYLRK